jgi:cell division protein FtsB
MRIFAGTLALILVLLQYRVWVSDHGVREVRRLTAAVQAQAAANVEQRGRNRQLVAEVNDLKGGLSAIEERARSDLGMVGNNETFYQVVTAAPPDATAPGVPDTSAAAARNSLTARTQ